MLGEGRLRGIREVAVPSRIDGGPGGQHLAGEPDAGSRLRTQLVRRHVPYRRGPDDVARRVDQPDRAVICADQLAGDVEQAREQGNEVGFTPHRVDEDLKAFELAREARRPMETGRPRVGGECRRRPHDALKIAVPAWEVKSVRLWYWRDGRPAASKRSYGHGPMAYHFAGICPAN